ncbi:MAG: hypothetical protein ACRC9P_10360 [Bacteroides sp.]
MISRKTAKRKQRQKQKSKPSGKRVGKSKACKACNQLNRIIKK